MAVFHIPQHLLKRALQNTQRLLALRRATDTGFEPTGHQKVLARLWQGQHGVAGGTETALFMFIWTLLAIVAFAIVSSLNNADLLSLAANNDARARVAITDKYCPNIFSSVFGGSGDCSAASNQLRLQQFEEQLRAETAKQLIFVGSNRTANAVGLLAAASGPPLTSVAHSYPSSAAPPVGIAPPPPIFVQDPSDNFSGVWQGLRVVAYAPYSFGQGFGLYGRIGAQGVIYRFVPTLQ